MNLKTWDYLTSHISSMVICEKKMADVTIMINGIDYCGTSMFALLTDISSIESQKHLRTKTKSK